jgi:hypothetical protein
VEGNAGSSYCMLRLLRLVLHLFSPACGLCLLLHNTTSSALYIVAQGTKRLPGSSPPLQCLWRRLPQEVQQQKPALLQ